jgi:hypothetical protein
MAYRGVRAEIGAGSSSLNSRQNVTQLQPSDLVEAEGVALGEGDWRKEPGTVLLDANGVSADPAILAGYHFPATNSVRRTIIAAGDGCLYKEVGSDLNSVTLASGLSTTAQGRFAQGGEEESGAARKLFYANGVDAVQVVSGDAAAAATVSVTPIDWTGTSQPRHLLPHAARMWGVMGHGLYASGIANHEDFRCAEAQYLPIYPGVGKYCVQLVEFGELLYIFKHPNGIFYLDDSDPRPQYWQVKAITDAEGMGAADTPYAALPVVGDILLLDTDAGFHLVSVLDRSTGSFRRSDLSERLNVKDWIRQNVNLNRLNQATSVWFEHKSLAVYSLPGVGSTVNNLRLMFDFTGYPNLIRFSYSTRDTLPSLWLHVGSDTIRRPAGGSNAGKVYLLDQEDRSNAGSGYTWKIKTVETDFSFLDSSLASRKKAVDFLEAVFNPHGSATVTAEVFRDGVIHKTIQFDASQQRQVKRVGGTGYRWAVRWSNSTDDEDVSLAAFRYWFRPGGR